MFSISDNEFGVINFLVRNFSRRYTMRSIALEIRQSPAGVFTILKKLEKHGIVASEKLGTGLFYSMNLENKIAKHMVAIILLDVAGVKDIDLGKAKNLCQAAMFDGKNLLLVTEHLASEDFKFKEISVAAKTRFEVEEGLRKRDERLLAIIQKGKALLGENIWVEIIKNGTARY